MKVVIKTEGGGKVGFGHFTRCISLYQAFLEKGVRPLFIINSSPEAKDILKKYKINFLIDKDPGIADCDILIIDSYLAPKDFYYKVSRKVKFLVSIDDYNRLDYPSGLVINGSIDAGKIRYKKNKKIKFLLGADYMPLRKSFWDIPRRNINGEAKDILVTFGGFKDDLAKRITELLIENTSFNLRVTLSKKSGFNRNSRVIFYHQVSDKKMKDLMINADICICGGGQTTYELARCGLPAVAICFADNQMLNLKGWSKAGSLEFAGWYDDKHIFDKVSVALKRLSYERRLKMSRVGQGIIDGMGARRAVENILKEYKQ